MIFCTVLVACSGSDEQAPSASSLPNTEQAQASTLTHDVAGNLLSVADSVDWTYNRTLAHDAINRVIKADGVWGNGSMQYDGAGNIRLYGMNSTWRVAQYDSTTNRLTHWQLEDSGVPKKVVSFSYDNYGNSVPSSSGYSYDNASNLKAADGRSYTYDATNKRVKTVANGVTTYEFRSAQGLLLAEWKKQSGYYDVLKEHIHVAGKEVAEQSTNFLGPDVLPAVGWMFLQHDASGSVLSSTWAGGGLLFKENYQPYGSQINGTAPGYTQRAFAGHKQDAPDLIYMGARYYNPQIGRFLSIDPKEADPSDLHSLNRYAYANNNPYRYVDPDGYTPVDLAFFAVDAARLGIAIYSGGNVAGAAINLGFSAVGVLSPIPYAGQVAKAMRAANAAVIAAKAADKALDAAKGTDANQGDGQVGVTKRPSRVRKGTEQSNWDNAKDSESGGKLCPTCGKGVKSKPGEKGKDWDNDHHPEPWRDRDLTGKDRQGVLDEYNTDTRLRCVSCNRSDNGAGDGS